MALSRPQREEIVIYGDDYDTPDGTCVRDYIHVFDLARAHLLALRALKERSRTYNLGNGHGFSVREVIEATREVTGHPIPAKIGPRRPGDPARLVASAVRAQEILNWHAQSSDIDTIVSSALNWHRSRA